MHSLKHHFPSMIMLHHQKYRTASADFRSNLDEENVGPGEPHDQVLHNRKVVVVPYKTAQSNTAPYRVIYILASQQNLPPGGWSEFVAFTITSLVR